MTRLFTKQTALSHLTLKCNLDLGPSHTVLNAHCLIVVNICVKFKFPQLIKELLTWQTISGQFITLCELDLGPNQVYVQCIVLYGNTHAYHVLSPPYGDLTICPVSEYLNNKIHSGNFLVSTGINLKNMFLNKHTCIHKVPYRKQSWYCTFWVTLLTRMGQFLFCFCKTCRNFPLVISLAEI